MSEAYHYEDELQRRSLDRRLLRRLLGYVRAYRRLILAATLLLLVAEGLSNFLPVVNMWAIDWYMDDPGRTELQRRIAAHEAAGEPVSAETLAALDRVRAEEQAGLLRLIGLIAAVMIGEGLIRSGQILIVTYVGQRTMLEMRMGLFAHLQRMSLRFLDRNPVGRLMTRVTNDIEKIQQTIVSGIVQVISDLFTIFVVLGFMFAVNWRLSLVTLSTVPLVFVTGLVFRRYARTTYFEIQKRIARLNACLQENVSGMREVQLFGREDRNFEEFRQKNAENRDEWFRQIQNYALYFPAVDFLGTLAIALILLYGGYRVLSLGGAAASHASIGVFFAYVWWADRLFRPIRAVADRYNLLLEAMASSERVFHLLDTPPDVEDRPDARACGRIEGRIAFKNVWFAYEEGQWVLRDIDLEIAPGERVAVVGHTGAGKSTLINLLSRFYDVSRGVVTVDGVDVREYAQESLRRNIGVVLQDVFLFSGSVEHNIRLGNREMDEADVRACAAHVNAARFIERLPDGYAYDVGERGCNLSVGQRQLLAFARTLAHDPQILVLDEATSSVDPETEALIQDATAKLMEGRTSIVIAHRLSTVQHADRIVVLHHGEIREVGTHRELLAKRGLYYTLYRLQYEDQAAARTAAARTFAVESRSANDLPAGGGEAWA